MYAGNVLVPILAIMLSGAGCAHLISTVLRRNIFGILRHMKRVRAAIILISVVRFGSCPHCIIAVYTFSGSIHYRRPLLLWRHASGVAMMPLQAVAPALAPVPVLFPWHQYQYQSPLLVPHGTLPVKYLCWSIIGRNRFINGFNCC